MTQIKRQCFGDVSAKFMKSNGRATHLVVEPWTTIMEDMVDVGDQRLDLDANEWIN